jgi:hypothetical protein
MLILKGQVTELNGNVTLLVAQAPGEPRCCSLALPALPFFQLVVCAARA